MNFRDRYAFDKKAAEEGSWVSQGGGLDIRVRRLNSKAVRTLNDQLHKPFKHLTKGGKSLPTDLQETINKKLLSQGVLTGWRDTPNSDEKGAPRNEDGSLIPYTPEAAVAIFDEFPDFMDDVAEAATLIDNFRSAELGEIEGN